MARRAQTRPGSRRPPLHEPFGDVPEANLFGEEIVGHPGEEFEIYLGGAARDNKLVTYHARVKKGVHSSGVRSMGRRSLAAED